MLPLLAGGVGALAGRFRTPSQKRARGPAEQFVASANAGNVTAAATILARTGFGIEKERVVWRAALQRVSQDMVLAAQRFGRQVLPLVDQSGPEAAARSAIANARDVSSFATKTAAKSKEQKRDQGDDRAPDRSTRKKARVRERGVEEEVSEEVAEAYQGRRQKAYERATGERWAKRYDPDTAEVWRVPESDPRFDEWTARRPRRGRGAGGAYGRRAGTRTNAALNRAARNLPAAAASLGVGTAAALAAVGAASYFVASRVLDDIAEGNTGANIVGQVTAMAHSDLTRKLKRQPTRAEYNALVVDVRKQLQAAVKESMAPSLKTQLRNFINLWR